MTAAKARRGKFRPLTQREITKAFEDYWNRNGYFGGGGGAVQPDQNLGSEGDATQGRRRNRRQN